MRNNCGQMHRHLVHILIPITVILYACPFFQWLSSRHQAPFALKDHAPAAGIEDGGAFMNAGFITPDTEGAMVHAASMCELPDGRLAAVWYGGSREGAEDVAVFFSRSRSAAGSSWSSPRMIVNRSTASEELDRYIKKVGNPVIFAGPDLRLYLIYVTVTVGGWSGSSLNVKISEDRGASWDKTRRLTLSPFFNISELVRNKPVFMTDGRIGVPIYHECMGDFPELLWLDPVDGKDKLSYRKTRMAGGARFIQPCVVPYAPFCATAFYRCRSGEKKTGMAVTTDGGAAWSDPQFLSLPNMDAGLDAVGLSDGRMLMVFNDTTKGRENLKMALSHDRGRSWRRIATVENSPGSEFSYPYLICTQSGQIHLLYTWHRKRIKHLVFNEAWVNEQLRGGVR